MPKVVKVALSGYNAEDDTDPSHFSLYLDGTLDHVLVKEKTRGVQAVASASEQTIAHSLGYFPFSAVTVEVSAGEYQVSYNSFGGAFNSFYNYVTINNLILGNQDGSSRDFTYLIFYDELE